MATHTPAFEIFRLQMHRARDLSEVVQEAFVGRVTVLAKRERKRLYRPTRRRLEKGVRAIDTSTQLLLVLVVTATETYLQEALAFCAGKDQSIMKDPGQKESGQVATYDQILAAESLDDLAHQLRLAWARNFVDDGGPKRWSERLVKMGAQPLAPEVLNRMELMWGKRHLVVHAAGRLTHDYLRRHPEPGAKPGSTLSLNPSELAQAFEDAEAFMQSAEAMFINRFM